jgi:hypothetical protein
MLCSSHDHLSTGMRDIDHPILAGAKNTDSWHTRKGDFQCAFTLDVLMVPSSAITVTADGEHMTCSGFSLSETICLGNIEFIADYFGGQSLSPRRGDSGTTFMASTRNVASSRQWAMIEDSIDEFLMMSSGDRGFGLPSPRRRGTGAPPALAATTPWVKDILDLAATQQVEGSL